MDNQPLISVIIPVYNVEKYIKRCVNSVLNQTYKNTEIILVDDGSTDSSGRICDNFSDKYENIKVIHKKNGGLSSARNAALNIAKGNYFAFVDSDDWIVNEMLSKLYGLIAEHNCDIASCSYCFSKREKDPADKNNKNKQVLILEGEEIVNYYMKSSFENTIGEYPVWNKLYSAELFNHIRFQEGITYEDMLPTFHLMQLANRFVKTQEPLYCYFINEGSITRGKLHNKDFYLLNVCDTFIEESRRFNDKNILKYAKLKKYRTYYSLLAKGLVYGVDSDVNDFERKKTRLLKLLRQHKMELVGSKIDCKRKMLIVLICVNPKFVEMLGKVIRGQ